MAVRTWFITGVSRGLGHALAKAVLNSGEAVIGTTRDGAVPPELASDRMTVLALELADVAQSELVVKQAHECHGRLDVVVNNAGYGLLGSVEVSSAAEVRRVFDINVFGPLAILRAALPLLRAQGRGHILNVSSVAAVAPAAGSGIYAAAKAAMSGLSQSLAQEVAPFGIWVTNVSPGAFRTDFLSDRSIRLTGAMIDDYAATSGRAVDGLLSRNGKQIGDPERFARAIIDVVNAEEPPLDLLLGSDALDRARRRLDRFEDDLRTWEAISLRTDFPS